MKQEVSVKLQDHSAVAVSAPSAVTQTSDAVLLRREVRPSHIPPHLREMIDAKKRVLRMPFERLHAEGA